METFLLSFYSPLILAELLIVNLNGPANGAYTHESPHLRLLFCLLLNFALSAGIDILLDIQSFDQFPAIFQDYIYTCIYNKETARMKTHKLTAASYQPAPSLVPVNVYHDLRS